MVRDGRLAPLPLPVEIPVIAPVMVWLAFLDRSALGPAAIAMPVASLGSLVSPVPTWRSAVEEPLEPPPLPEEVMEWKCDGMSPC